MDIHDRATFEMAVEKYGWDRAIEVLKGKVDRLLEQDEDGLQRYRHDAQHNRYCCWVCHAELLEEVMKRRR